MKSFGIVSRIMFILALTLLCETAHSADEAASRRFALVVGVAEYDPDQPLPPLSYSRNDAHDLAKVLRERGFDVRLMVDDADTPRTMQPTAARIRREIDNLASRPGLGPDDVIVVAFAGHGVKFAANGAAASEARFFYCPADARLGESEATSENLVSLEQVFKSLEKCPAGLRLLLVDACRNDPQAPQAARAAGSVTLPLLAPPPGGLLAYFSCSANQRAFEDARLRRGVFLHHVIVGLEGAADQTRDGSITVTELAEFASARTHDFVLDRFATRQVPELRGEFRGSVPLVKLNRPSIDQGLIERLREEARSLSRQGDFLSALGRLSRVTDLDPAHVSARVERSHVYSDLHIWYGGDEYGDQALLEAETALSLDRQSVPALVRRAEVLSNRGEYRLALADASRAIELSPRLADAYLARSWCHEGLKQPDSMDADMSKALELEPDSADVWNLKGTQLFNRGRYDDGLKAVDRAIEIEPSRSLYHNNRGYGLSAAGKDDEALAAYDRAILLSPRHAGYLLSRSRIHEFLKDDTRAKADIDAARKLAPAAQNGIEAEVEFLAARDQSSAARALVDNTIASQPTNGAWYELRAKLRANDKDLSGAVADLTRRLELTKTPRDKERVLIMRGYARLKNSQPQAALEDYDIVLQRSPDAPHALYGKSQALRELSRPKEALPFIERLLRQRPDDPALFEERAAVYQALGRTAEAQADLNRAEKLRKP